MPKKYFVSRWSREENIEMTYSYVGINGCGDDYDKIAEEIDGKLFFAGEVSFSVYFLLLKDLRTISRNCLFI